MKSLLLLLAALPLFAQGGLVYQNAPILSGDVSITAATAPAQKQFVVHWTSIEKCLDCMSTLAVMCYTDNGEGCGTPMTVVDHWDSFATVEEALSFVNHGFTDPNENFFTAGLRRRVIPHQPEFVGIFKLAPVELVKQVTKIEEPQPPKVTETVTYTKK